MTVKEDCHGLHYRPQIPMLKSSSQDLRVYLETGFSQGCLGSYR